MKPNNLLYVTRTGKRSLLIEYLIRQGVAVKIIKNTGEIRGMKADYIIVDDLIEEDLE
tara:strand:- start:286 stop:459 length:174 start_codon:yes stop_codon:yes gene_type:complete